MMKITFLGSGSAFCLENFNSNVLLENEGKKLLIDCGGDIRWSLNEKKLKLTDIDAVYISHSHADHSNGLEGLAFSTYFSKTANGDPKPKLFGQKELLNDLWSKTLCGGLASIQTIDATLDTYFEVNGVENNGSFDFAGINFKIVQTVHVVADKTFVKSFGLIFTTPNNNKKVFYTSDTQFCPAQIKDFIKKSDIVFHDCETSKYPSNVHAHYEDLKALPEDTKKKMWLYHYNDGELPDAKKDGFKGFVDKGQEFEEKFL